MRVWVTRALPEAQRTADRLTAAGHQPLLAPLLTVHPLPAAADLAKGLDGAGAIAFTSANAVRAFAALRPLSDRHLPAFTVGAATAHAAREAGFATVISAEGDAHALAQAIAEHAGRLAGAVLHPAAQEPAGDLIGDLTARGLTARAVAVYETRQPPLSAEALLALQQSPPAIDVVLIHSAKAARALLEILQGRPETAAALAVVCISKAAAEPLSALKLGRRTLAAKPNEASMMERLEA